MFAPTFSLEAVQRDSISPQPEKTMRSGLARRAKKPVATLVTCLLTLGMAMTSHAQNVVITTSPDPITEGSASGVARADFQVSLDSPATADATITVATANGTATSPEDFQGIASPTGTGTGTTVTIAAGTMGPVTVSVPIVGDDVYEPNNGGIESFSLFAAASAYGSNPGPSITGANRSATAQIRDDDPAPIISISDPAAVTEGNTGTTNLNFTVTLSNPSSQSISVNYAAGADTSAPEVSATPGTDFQNTSSVLTFSPGSVEASFSVPVIGDLVDEGTETFLVTLSNPTGGALLGQSQARGTINDDDGPSVSITDVRQTEGDDFIFNVTLSAPSPETVTVRFATRNDTATAPQDYTAASGDLTFFPGVVNQEITINTVDDNLVENPTEQFTVGLSSASTGVTFSDNLGVGTIVDNEDPPILSVANVSKLEGAQGTTTTFTFTAVLNTPSTRPITFSYATSPGSPNPASAGIDYRTTSGSVTFAANTTERSFDVIVIGDNTDERDETFNVTLTKSQSSSVSFNGGGNTLVATGTILNDDGPDITFVNRSVSVAEGAAGARTNATFVVQLSAPSTHAVSVRYRTDRGLTNPATPGSDFTSTTGTLNFPAGVTTQQIQVEVKGDNVDENDETFFVILSGASGGTVAATQDTATGTIRDDDAAPVISISNVTGNEGAQGTSTNFSFVLALDRSSAQTVTVDFATADVTATADVDYSTFSGTATFNPGVTKQTVNVRVLGDNFDEPTETFRVNLANPTNATIATRTSFGIGTIRDDDATPQLSITAAALAVNENGAAQAPATVNQLNFTVSLSAPAGQAISFDFRTVAATANNGQLRPASPGSDFRSTSGTATIAAGAQFTTIPVEIFGDTLDEYDEYFNVVIDNPVGATIRRSTGTGVIIDDDAAGTLAIAAPTADNQAVEGGRNGAFVVTLSAASGRDVTVFYSIAADGQNNRATPGLDIVPTNETTGSARLKETTGSITIRAGQTTGTIRVAALADKQDEPEFENYRVFLTRAVPADYGIPQAGSSAAGTIEDRNVGFTSFTPREGNQSYNNANNNGTDVVLTGNQFTIGDVSQVDRIVFGVLQNNVPKGIATRDFNITSPTSITVTVPPGAISGRIRIVTNRANPTNSEIVLSPTGNQADRLFYVNAAPTGFNPDRGIPRKTVVLISGVNLRDVNNPVVGVRFNGTNSNVQTAGVDPVVISQNGQNFVRATVPSGASSGPITLVTRNGTVYPPSVDSFTVDTATTGSIRFASTPTYVVNENERGDLKNPLNPVPVRNRGGVVPVQYTLQLVPSVQQDPARTQVPPRGDVVVRLQVVDILRNADGTAAGNGARSRFPAISSTNGRVTNSYGRVIDVTFKAGSFENKTISLVDAGNDLIKPDFIATGFFQEQNAQQLQIRASIIRSGDQEFYPVDPNLGTDLADAQITADIARTDVHGLDTDIGTVFRTSEAQASTNATTAFKVNLRNINNGVDVASDFLPISVGKKYSGNPQPTLLNPDGTVNQDGEPKQSVGLPFIVNAPDEALIRYYVLVPINGDGRNGFTKIYPGGAVFGTRVVMVYDKDISDEYFKYDHFIEAKGVDDDIQDGPQEFQITLDNSGDGNQNSNSVDPEYLRLNLVTPFTLVNDDNEQSTGNNQPGFVFSPLPAAPANQVPTLTTNEAGSQAFFQVRLRSQPANGGKVTLRLQTSNPSEVLLIDPSFTTRTTVETLDLTFFANSEGSGNGKESRWDKPITVLVTGVDDNNLDGNQVVPILTSTVVSSTTDPAYQTIDPLNPVVTNIDNESNGVTVTPRNLVIDEGGTDSFSVRVNSRPTGNVTINVTSSDPTVATPLTTRLTFTPDNWTVAQTVTVRGVADNGFNPQRAATILLSNASSSDVNFDNLDVPDVTVTVQNQTQAFLISPTAVLTTGVTTSEDGRTDTFTVRLSNQPTQGVALVLTVSSGEATLSSGSARGDSITLNFTPENFSRTQTVTVTGVDDEAQDGNQSYNINGTVTTVDPVYSQQGFPSIPGINLDNDGVSTGGDITYAANGTYTVSFPYADSSGTLTQAQAFSLASGTGTPNFTLYKFNVTAQRNSRALNGGSDFTVVPAGEKLVRGIGYRLVTGSQAIKLNQPSTTLKAFTGTTFPLTLSWNPNFLDQTSDQDNRNNGYNFIGFPFDPSKYNRTSFASSQVKYGDETYATVADAAAAGIIDQSLFTVDAQGNLSAVADSQIRPYRAYFVRILRNDKTVVLTLRNPSN
jgi:hypothetical protein